MELLLLQGKVWRLDGAELLTSSGGVDSVVLGVLEDSVISLAPSGLVTTSQTQTVETQLENPEMNLTPVNSVTLPKCGKVFVVTKDGFLYQVHFD